MSLAGALLCLRPAPAAGLRGNVGYAMFERGDDLPAAHFLQGCAGATARLNEGDAYAAAGWTGRAIDCYAEALKAGLAGRQRARARAVLARLRARQGPAAPPPARAFVAVWGASAHDVLAYGQGSDGRMRLYRTRDLGRTWKAVAVGADTLVGVAGSGPSDIWALGTRALWHSRDDGAAFVRVPLPTGGRWSRVFVTRSGTVLLAREAHEDTPVLVVSRDQGARWRRATLPSAVGSVRDLADAGKALYLVGDATPRSLPDVSAAAIVLRSRRGGRSWTPLHLAHPYDDNRFDAVAADPSGVVLALGRGRNGNGGSGLMSRSTDHGRHWSAPREDDWVTDATYRCGWVGAWLGRGGQAVIVGDKPLCAVEYSADHGASFRHPRVMPPSLAGDNRAVWGTRGAIFVAGSGGVFLSTDGGATWQDRTPR